MNLFMVQCAMSCMHAILRPSSTLHAHDWNLFSIHCKSQLSSPLRVLSPNHNAWQFSVIRCKYLQKVCKLVFDFEMSGKEPWGKVVIREQGFASIWVGLTAQKYPHKFSLVLLFPLVVRLFHQRDCPYHTCVHSGAASTIIGEANIHIFVFTDHKNNRFQKKLIMQNTKIWIFAPPPPNYRAGSADACAGQFRTVWEF